MWYLIENGTQLPNTFSTEELQARMAAAPGGTYMVWKTGMASWADPRTLNEFKSAAPAGPAAPAPQPAAPQPAAPQPASGPTEPKKDFAASGKAFFGSAADQFKKIHEGESTHAFLPHLRWIDGILGWFGGKVPADKLDAFDELAKKWGNVGMLLSAVAIVIFGICQGIKGSFGQSLLMAVVMFLGILIVQYVAIKFLNAGKSLIKKSPTHLSSRSFLDCLGLLLMLMIPAALIGGIVTSIQAKSFIPAVIGIGSAVYFIYILAVTMKPETVNVSVAGDATAGQEAIAILTFFMKLSLRIVPLIFGIVNVLAPFAILYFSIAILVAEFPFAYIALGGQMVAAVFASALYPLMAYLLFLIMYLFLDVIQAILEIPGKIEELKQEEN